MRIVGNAQLVRDGQQQRVGLGDGLVLLELFDQGIRLGGVAAAEDRACVRVDESDLVVTVARAPEISAGAIVDQRKDAAADRNARLAPMAGLLPGGAVFADLRRLLHMEGLARFVVLERRALQVHPKGCRPDRRGVRAGTPPDPLPQAFEIWLEAQHPWWF